MDAQYVLKIKSLIQLQAQEFNTGHPGALEMMEAEGHTDLLL